jgi:adenine deaminase
MNYPGLILGDPAVLDKVRAFEGRIIDGHSPGVSGPWLNAYVAAGVGSDHECTTVEEALERLRLGMYVLVREATEARNLRALLPAITPANSRRCCFCTDDRHPADLLDHGHLDHVLRLAIQQGLDPVTAIRMVTLNTAEWFRLYDRGAVAPGKRADMVVFTNLDDVQAELVFSGGRLVAQDGEPVGDWPFPLVDDTPVRNTVHLNAIDESTFHIPASGSQARVIGVVKNQVVTTHLVQEIARDDHGRALPDLERDVLKMAVIERHRGTGNVGRGFIHGMGLLAGALASTVAHDHHNVVVVGVDDESMLAAVREVSRMGGGFAAANGELIIASLPLPIAGLMSDQSAEEVRDALDTLHIGAAALGAEPHNPFMVMGFMALEVIPALKLTDQGLVDVEQFKLVDLWVGE